MLVAVPPSIALAVLRYRLYDIDRLISATVLYSGLTALLGGAFVGVIVLVGVVLGDSSTITTAVATLACGRLPPAPRPAAAPGRPPLQPARYDALEAVDAFLADVRAGRQSRRLSGTLADGLRRPSLRLFFWLPDPASTPTARATGARAAGPARRPDAISRGDLRLATSSTTQPPRARPARSTPSWCAPAWRSRSLGYASRCGDSSPRSGSRQRILPRPRPSAAGSSATCTTARSSGWCRSGSTCAPPADARGRRVSAALDGAVSRLADGDPELRDLANGVRPNALEPVWPPRSPAGGERTGADRVDATPQRFAAEVEAAASSWPARVWPTRSSTRARAGSRLVAAHADGSCGSRWSTTAAAARCPRGSRAGRAGRPARRVGRTLGDRQRPGRGTTVGGRDPVRLVARRGPGPAPSGPRPAVRRRRT